VNMAANGTTPRSRLKLGIGELVLLYVVPDPGTLVTWTTSAGTITAHTSSPPDHSMMQLNAPNSPDASITVQASFAGLGAPLTITFSTVIPTGTSMQTGTPVDFPPLNGLSANHDGSWLWSGSYFQFRLGDTDVSFDFAHFRENIPAYSSTWPSGDPFRIPASTGNVFQSDSNVITDQVYTISPYPDSWLVPAGGGSQIDTTFTNTGMKIEYKDDSGIWHATGISYSHVRSYFSDGTSQSPFQFDSGGGLKSGNLQGPWDFHP
jgi:hypothetical protein